MAKSTITRDMIDTILHTAGTRFMSVEFMKKDGTIRPLQGHLKVKKHLKGGTSSISNNNDLVSIYDMRSKGYRCFSKSRLQRIRVDGNIYTVTG